MLRHESRDIDFYLVDLYEDQDGTQYYEGHYEVPPWRGVVAWTSCALALLLLVGSPVLLIAVVHFQVSPLWFLVYLSLPAFYVISFMLWSPRCMLSAERVTAIRLLD